MLNILLKQIWGKAQKDEKLLLVLARIYNMVNFRSEKIRGKKNLISYKTSFLKKVKITIIGDNNRIIINNRSRLINSKINMIGSNHILEIGDNCIISNCTLNFEDENDVISIGNDTSIEGAKIATIEQSKIIIGEDCMLADKIEIRTGDSHSIIDVKSNKRINPSKDIKIGNHVWIGTSVTILKGNTIGENCTIGIGSIITKDVPKDCIAVGIPAEVIKENTNWKRERIEVG